MEPRRPADIDALASLAAGLEPDGKGTPESLRQHLRLGGRVLRSNIDAGFANRVECPRRVDPCRTDLNVLRRHMSARARFQQGQRSPRNENGIPGVG